MNFQKSFLLIVLCAVFTNATAQKYVTKSEAEVKTKWNEVTFSSNKTLTENISDLGTFSYLMEFLMMKISKIKCLSKK